MVSTIRCFKGEGFFGYAKVAQVTCPAGISLCKTRTHGMYEFRVARWFVFKPKIPIWVNFWDLRWENVDIFYGHLEYYKDIWEI
jgi:hypothetical protein